jgi:hypothetical protein
MSGLWNNHPSLQGRFHEEFPDDLQVIVHDGQPTVTNRGAELVWVQVTGCGEDVAIFGGTKHLSVFRGTVLNRPHQLQTVSEGSEIQFVVPTGGEHPVQVTAQYLQERPGWRLLAPCKKCGMSELFDAPSIIVEHMFPNLTPDQLSGFTFKIRCGWCGGGQVVRLMRKPSP